MRVRLVLFSSVYLAKNIPSPSPAPDIMKAPIGGLNNVFKGMPMYRTSPLPSGGNYHSNVNSITIKRGMSFRKIRLLF